MPGGITLLESPAADIPTPATGKSTIFIDSATGVPSYKDDLGNVLPLGTTGATGPAGSVGPPGFGGDGGGGDSESLSSPSAANISAQTTIKVITCKVDGGGSVITTGVKGYFRTPVALTVLSWTILSQDGLTGSIVFDVWVDTFAAFPPTVLDTITAAAKPTVAAATNAEGSAVTWLSTIPAGSVVGINVDSVTTLKSVTLELVTRVN